MNERERWVVYPLLFLALGVSLRDKMIKTTASQRVETESLLVTGSSGQPLAVLGNERFGPMVPSRQDFLNVDVIRVDELYVKNLHVQGALWSPLAMIDRVRAAHYVQQFVGKSIDLSELVRRFLSAQIAVQQGDAKSAGQTGPQQAAPVRQLPPGTPTPNQQPPATDDGAQNAPPATVPAEPATPAVPIEQL